MSHEDGLSMFKGKSVAMSDDDTGHRKGVWRHV